MQQWINFAVQIRIMSKKHTSRPDGLAYSTNKDFFNDFPAEENVTTQPKDKQKLRVKLDTKQRAGKVVTLVEGFAGSNDDLEALGKQLKTKCGAGGSVKDGLVMIQGDYKDKVVTWLKDWGYIMTR
jgi:translation initiation factor 1